MLPKHVPKKDARCKKLLVPVTYKSIYCFISSILNLLSKEKLFKYYLICAYVLSNRYCVLLYLNK